METSKTRISITSLVDSLLARHGIAASARVIRVTSAVYVLVTVQEPALLAAAFDGPSPVSELILRQLRDKLHPQLAVAGIFWTATRRHASSDSLQQQRKALSEKIRALRLSRTDIGLESD